MDDPELENSNALREMLELRACLFQGHDAQ